MVSVIDSRFSKVSCDGMAECEVWRKGVRGASDVKKHRTRGSASGSCPPELSAYIKDGISGKVGDAVGPSGRSYPKPYLNNRRGVKWS
jgi:hypothetical protein